MLSSCGHFTHTPTMSQNQDGPEAFVEVFEECDYSDCFLFWLVALE